MENFDRLKKFDRWKNSIDFLNRFALFRLDFSSDFLPKKRAIHQAHAIMYCTQQMIQGGKLSRLAKKPRKFSPSKVLPYTVSDL